MIWVFGALLFVPLVIVAFLIMRVDLLLHFLRKREDEQAAAEPPPPPSEQS
jgi:hypothetical protein